MARSEFHTTIRKEGHNCGVFKANEGRIGGRISSLVSFDQLNHYIVHLQLILHLFLLRDTLQARQQKEYDLVLIIPSMYFTHHLMSLTGGMAIG